MLETVLYYVAAGAGAAFQLASACHALLNKRDPRSQLGWLVLCIMLPMVGAIAYWMFGVNRIRTRARRWKLAGRFRELSVARSSEQAIVALAQDHPARADALHQLLHIADRVTRRPLIGGNAVEPLYNGEQAYPAMLEAIRAAERHIYMSTYLFDTDKVGRDFIDALGAAAERGVDVRVLVDAIGEKYSRPRVSKALRRYPAVKVGLFLPLTLSVRSVRVNMRNHRKLVLVDGRVGFTGGMNIGLRHMVVDPDNRTPTADIHFRVRGPVVTSMIETFLEDWFFVIGSAEAPPALETPAEAGRALCRAIKDGPNEDFERLQWILVGAMSCARETIRIITPYFIPGRELLAALNSAVLRGVRVELILPAASNLPFVDWACRAMLWEVLQYGVKVYWQPPPFDHSKLLVVDDFYVNLGSANLDPRSLRLNFELNLEVFDPDLATELVRHFEVVRARSRVVTLEVLDGRPFALKIRDATAKLFAPYL